MRKKIIHKECFILGLLFSGFISFGYELSKNGYFNYTFPAWGPRILNITLLTVFSTLILELFFRYLTNKGASIGLPTTDTMIGRFRKTPIRTAVFAGVFLCVCWLPVFLAFYPGIYAYDTPNQTWQVLSQAYNTHHPLFHTLFMGYFVVLGQKIHSYNLGIAIYTSLQMIITASILSYCLYLLLKWRCRTWLWIFSVGYFALYPTCSLFSISATKDTLFSAFFTLTVFLLVDLLHFHSVRKHPILQWGLYIISAVATCLFRNNGIYALAFMLPFLLLSHKRWKLILSTLAAIILYLVINCVMGSLFHPTKGSVAEMLSIPIQQFGRMVYLHGEELSQEDYDLLHTYIDEEKLTLYNPYLSDPIKDGFNGDAFSDSPAAFLSTWFHFFKRYPGTFLDAFLFCSLGNWYPGNNFHTYIELDVKNMWGQLPDMRRDSKLPLLEQAYTTLFIGQTYRDTPILSILFNPVFFIWLLFITIGYLLYHNKLSIIPALVPYVGLWGTLLLGPIALVRYMVPIIFSLPLLLFLLFHCQTGSINR